MCYKTVIKGFIAGMAFPAIFLPLAYTMLYFTETETIQTHPLQFVPMYIPLLFGIANVIYLSIYNRCGSIAKVIKLWVTGIMLGFVVALIGIFAFDIPTLIFGLRDGCELLPLVLLPIIYGLIFRYIVDWLNTFLGLN